MTTSNTSINWKKVFDEYSILDSVNRDGYADISNTAIKSLNLEPRLLGKIDHREQLPQVFSENKLSLLTISNSAYRIGPFENFMDLPEWKPPGNEVKHFSTPTTYETLNFDRLSSETQVISAANVSDILEDFFGEPAELTISGRARTPEFDFEVKLLNGSKQKINVSKAQIEIDAGFEGRNAFYIIEAKNHAATNFNLRQLYYPYRTWIQKINKPVKPVFLTYSNDVYDFFIFDFSESNEMNSVELLSHHRYMLEHGKITLQEIDKIAKSIRPVPPPSDVPFPQADSFERVIDLVSILVNDSGKSQLELAEHYVFATRQSDYYFNAANFLGLAVKEISPEGEYVRVATDRAREIFSMDYKEKYIELSKLILSIPGMARLYLDWRHRGKPSVDNVKEYIEMTRNGKEYRESTIERRSQTVLSWISWVISLPNN